MKPTNYYAKFCNLAKKYEIWFSVYGNGALEEVTFTNAGFDVYPPYVLKLGTKAAYEWLVKVISGEDTKSPTLHKRKVDNHE